MMKIRLLIAAASAAFLLAASLSGAGAQSKRIKDLTNATSTTVGDRLPIDGTTLRSITVENLLTPQLMLTAR
jgi:hypothetical protein